MGVCQSVTRYPPRGHHRERLLAPLVEGKALHLSAHTHSLYQSNKECQQHSMTLQNSTKTNQQRDPPLSAPPACRRAPRPPPPRPAAGTRPRWASATRLPCARASGRVVGVCVCVCVCACVYAYVMRGGTIDHKPAVPTYDVGGRAALLILLLSTHHAHHHGRRCRLVQR